MIKIVLSQGSMEREPMEWDRQYTTRAYLAGCHLFGKKEALLDIDKMLLLSIILVAAHKQSVLPHQGSSRRNLI